MHAVHDVPETGSWQRQHVLDDEATCWCQPITEVANRLMITHRKEDGDRAAPSTRGRCEFCQAWTWCRFAGPAGEMPCDADPHTGRRPGT